MSDLPLVGRKKLATFSGLRPCRFTMMPNLRDQSRGQSFPGLYQIHCYALAVLSRSSVNGGNTMPARLHPWIRAVVAALMVLLAACIADAAAARRESCTARWN